MVALYDVGGTGPAPSIIDDPAGYLAWYNRTYQPGTGPVPNAAAQVVQTTALATIQPGSPPAATPDMWSNIPGYVQGQPWWQNLLSILNPSNLNKEAGMLLRDMGPAGQLSTVAKAVGISAGVITGGLIIYGILQAAGVRFPWERQTDASGNVVDVKPGPGYRAWATQTVRSDGSIAVTTFAREPNGRMHVVAPDGTTKTWMPRKPIVLYRGKITLSQAVKAQRTLDKLWHTTARKVKQLKLA